MVVGESNPIMIGIMQAAGSAVLLLAASVNHTALLAQSLAGHMAHSCTLAEQRVCIPAGDIYPKC